MNKALPFFFIYGHLHGLIGGMVRLRFRGYVGVNAWLIDQKCKTREGKERENDAGGTSTALFWSSRVKAY